MADERTTPTPKSGVTDTMHSTPEVPDRARGEGDQRGVATKTMADAPSHGGSVGGERPGKTVISAGEFKPDPSMGTLVTDLPDMREVNTPDDSPVNPGAEAPDSVARQPNETREEAGKRIRSETKSSSSGTKAKSSTSRKSTSKSKASTSPSASGSAAKASDSDADTKS